MTRFGPSIERITFSVPSGCATYYATKAGKIYNIHLCACEFIIRKYWYNGFGLFVIPLTMIIPLSLLLLYVIIVENFAFPKLGSVCNVGKLEESFLIQIFS